MLRACQVLDTLPSHPIPSPLKRMRWSLTSHVAPSTAFTTPSPQRPEAKGLCSKHYSVETPSVNQRASTSHPPPCGVHSGAGRVSSQAAPAGTQNVTRTRTSVRREN